MSVPRSRRYATTRPKLAARRARRHRATRARTLAARIRVESARANVFTMMASSLGSSLAPVAGAPRARRGPRASRATSSTASDSSSRLDALLGEDLGDAVRTSLRRRDTAAAIDAAVASLERDSPTDHPVASLSWTATGSSDTPRVPARSGASARGKPSSAPSSTCGRRARDDPTAPGSPSPTS